MRRKLGLHPLPHASRAAQLFLGSMGRALHKLNIQIVAARVVNVVLRTSSALTKHLVAGEELFWSERIWTEQR